MSSSSSPLRRLLIGTAAGAAGTTALNAVTYLDMAVRGRPTSSTPEDTVEELSDLADVQVPGDENTRQNRLQGLGPLLGIVTGVSVGAAYGIYGATLGRPPLVAGALLTAAAAMVGSTAPMTALGLEVVPGLVELEVAVPRLTPAFR